MLIPRNVSYSRAIDNSYLRSRVVVLPRERNPLVVGGRQHPRRVFTKRQGQEKDLDINWSDTITYMTGTCSKSKRQKGHTDGTTNWRKGRRFSDGGQGATERTIAADGERSKCQNCRGTAENRPRSGRRWYVYSVREQPAQRCWRRRWKTETSRDAKSQNEISTCRGLCSVNGTCTVSLSSDYVYRRGDICGDPCSRRLIGKRRTAIVRGPRNRFGVLSDDRHDDYTLGKAAKRTLGVNRRNLSAQHALSVNGNRMRSEEEEEEEGRRQI